MIKERARGFPRDDESRLSGVSASETDLAACGREDFWLIVTIKEWR